ncbi:MAG TPA: T9SS type A sorting domain-containing protein [Candidatus Paceibacterota bacterium]|nr:T9SS type A sorting domain-containing protein [Candidatus Paceibacterota bacterium]
MMKPMVALNCMSLLLIIGATSVLTAQWSQIPGTEGERDAVVAADGQYLYAGTYLGSLRRTADSGRTWTYANTDLPDSSIFVTMYGEPGLLLLGTGKGVFRSTDHGEHWQSVADSITKRRIVHQFYRLGRFVFVASDSGLARSTDFGASWARLTIPLSAPEGVFCVAGHGDYLLVGVDGDGIFKSIDSGAIWGLVNLRHGGDLVTSICTGDGFWLAHGGSDILLYRSVDSGASWVNMNRSLSGLISEISVLHSIDPNYAVAGSDVGVILSQDNGATWKRVNDGLPNSGHIAVLDVCIVTNEMLIATNGAGCFRRPLSELITPPSGVDDATTGAAATHLGQSIPNPTSGEVMIPYSLAAGGHVSITLYNSLLQQVATVVDAEEPSGPHTARLDASALPPGAYYCRLHAGSVNLTKQMIIVR